jgi:hypothetical protein
MGDERPERMEERMPSLGIENVDQQRTVRGEPILAVLQDIVLDPVGRLGAPSADYDEWLKFETLTANGFRWTETIIVPIYDGGVRPWTGEHRKIIVLRRAHNWDVSVGIHGSTPPGIDDLGTL